VTIDLAVLAAIAVFGLLGLFSGAIKQLAHLGGLVVGFLTARPLAALVGPEIAARWRLPPLFTNIAASFVLFFLVYVVAVLLLRFVLGRLLPDGERGGLNRFGGLLLGAAKAALIAFVALSALVLVEKHVQKLWRGYRKEARSSIALQLVRRHNLFARVPQLGGLERIVEAGRDPQAAARLAEDPELQAIARDPRVRRLSSDAAVQRAFETGDYTALLSSVRVLEVLNDPKLSEKLLRFASGPRPSKDEAASGEQPSGKDEEPGPEPRRALKARESPRR
jgi:membrane protein required for colicin V production